MQPFTGTLQVETDATVVYAVVFNGAAGNAPVNGVSLAAGLHQDQERRANAECLAGCLPPGGSAVGAQSVAVTHSKLGMTRCG